SRTSDIPTPRANHSRTGPLACAELGADVSELRQHHAARGRPPHLLLPPPDHRSHQRLTYSSEPMVTPSRDRPSTESRSSLVRVAHPRRRASLLRPVTRTVITAASSVNWPPITFHREDANALDR